MHAHALIHCIPTQTCSVCALTSQRCTCTQGHSAALAGSAASPARGLQLAETFIFQMLMEQRTLSQLFISPLPAKQQRCTCSLLPPAPRTLTFLSPATPAPKSKIPFSNTPLIPSFADPVLYPGFPLGSNPLHFLSHPAYCPNPRDANASHLGVHGSLQYLVTVQEGWVL